MEESQDVGRIAANLSAHALSRIVLKVYSQILLANLNTYLVKVEVFCLIIDAPYVDVLLVFFTGFSQGFLAVFFR